ncbi:MAG TPA: glutamate synthase subunit alpha, partial [Burkholderiales bacterium]|nr:glutamate synthase subunit alpha [Burkholderiales bacterium]
VDLLESLVTPDSGLDLSKLLLPGPGRARRYVGEPNRVNRAAPLNDRLVAEAGPLDGASAGFQQLAYTISNRDRTVGARLAGEIARRHGDAGLPEGSLEVTFTGYAGQSFGAFGVPGLNLTLHGQANDYVGKGLTGGRLVIAPPRDAADPAEPPVMAGNTILYGATGGTVFIGGRAGERFGVRNSGAVAVVEGVGDHGCEYMTGGTVAVLGSTGRNFAAGMSGGIAYVLDLDGDFAQRCNPAMVDLEPVLAEVEQQAKGGHELWHLGQTDEANLRRLIEAHLKCTGSKRAQQVLEKWTEYRARFVKVFPKEYRRALGELAASGRKQAA